MKRTLAALAGGALAASLAAIGLVVAQPYPAVPPPPPGATPPEAPPQQQPPPQTSPNSLGEGWRLQQDEVRQGVRQRRLMPLGRVIEQIRRRTPGRQLDAGLEYRGGRPVYRIRWMTRDGRRVDYLIDAATGAILGKD